MVNYIGVAKITWYVRMPLVPFLNTSISQESFSCSAFTKYATKITFKIFLWVNFYKIYKKNVKKRYFFEKSDL